MNADTVGYVLLDRTNDTGAVGCARNNLRIAAGPVGTYYFLFHSLPFNAATVGCILLDPINVAGTVGCARPITQMMRAQSDGLVFSLK